MNKRRGFTLIELMIAIAIMGLMGEFLYRAPAFFMGSLNSLQTSQNEYDQIRSALTMMEIDVRNRAWDSDSSPYQFDSHSGYISRNGRRIMAAEGLRYSELNHGMLVYIEKGGREWVFWFSRS